MSVTWPDQIAVPAEQSGPGARTRGLRTVADTRDPLVLGLSLTALAAVALGLELTGAGRGSSGGSPLTVVTAGGGLGLLLTSAWSASHRTSHASGPWAPGTSLPATVLGVLAAFFLSYATVVLGFGHGWLTAAPRQAPHTVALFQVSWIVLFVLIGLASVRLPAALTALLAAFTVALTLLLVSTLGPAPLAGRLGGIVVLLTGVAAGSLFVAVAFGRRDAPGRHVCSRMRRVPRFDQPIRSATAAAADGPNRILLITIAARAGDGQATSPTRSPTMNALPPGSRRVGGSRPSGT